MCTLPITISDAMKPSVSLMLNELVDIRAKCMLQTTYHSTSVLESVSSSLADPIAGKGRRPTSAVLGSHALSPQLRASGDGGACVECDLRGDEVADEALELAERSVL